MTHIDTCASWARELSATDEIRRAAIDALVDVENTNPEALAALRSITDPLGRHMVRQARRAVNPHANGLAMADDFGRYGQLFAEMEDSRRQQRRVMFGVAVLILAVWAALAWADPVMMLVEVTG